MNQDTGDTVTELTEPHVKPCSRLAVIADLLADLPEDERRAVIANLSPAERVTVARLLIQGDGQGGEA